ncbi:hypothetical protein [Sulfitobacter dubius]|uniref:hypothetical protein n=1 Tax=Sulfitobacter dubius TaxID=218673 RepID=UPI002941E752|nr:hypothetical protein [Sulfitobacter dubius]WOI29134.1 hypothetical protein R1T39_15855 [Sulfitobacter dubius]
MYLLYCDETNLESRAGDFLIYGGLSLTEKGLISLSNGMDTLRAKYGVPAEYSLKFAPPPEGMCHKDFMALKSDVIKLISDSGGQFISYLVLHDIAKDRDEARRNGVNTVCYHFQYFLERDENTPYGLVLIDQFNDKGNRINAHLREKFSTGLVGIPGLGVKRMDRILGFHYSAIGQAHAPSAVDIFLGTFRFIVNAHTRGEKGKLAACKMLGEAINPIFWRKGSSAAIPELGVYFSPKDVKVERYRTQYASARKHLLECGIDLLE